MLHISNTDTLKSIYFVYFHSLKKYGKSSGVIHLTAKRFLYCWRKLLRLMMGVNSRSSCRYLFKRLEILTVPCEYVCSLINFITNIEDHFHTNQDVHSVNTRHKHYTHKPTANLSCVQKSTYYAGIKIFSILKSDLKSIMNEKTRFNIALKRYSKHTHSTLFMNTYCLKSESFI
jgi:hypothetical protein